MDIQTEKALLALAVGQQIIASFNDSPDRKCLVIDFDQRELKRNLLKKDVTINVLIEVSKGKFIHGSITQRQVEKVGAVITLKV